LDLEFKSLLEGSGISISGGVDGIVLSSTASSSGEANSGTSLGTGEPVFAQKNGDDLEFKTLKEGTNITLSSDSDEITINSTDTGEANTASNEGSGIGAVFKQKTGYNLEFRNIKAGDNVTVSLVGNDILIGSTGGGGATGGSSAEFGRIYRQRSQDSEVELTDSDTPYDIPNLHLTVPLDGTYLVSYSTTFEAYVSDESIHTLDVSSVLYNDTQNSYIPEGKARTSMKFGNDSTTDLISKTRKMIHTVSKDVFVDADASDTIKLMGI